MRDRETQGRCRGDIPKEPEPHEKSAPSAAAASECSSPAAQQRIRCDLRVERRRGSETVVWSPWPSLPHEPSPHEYILPSSVIASMCLTPAASTTTLLRAPPSPSTRAGLRTW